MMGKGTYKAPAKKTKKKKKKKKSIRKVCYTNVYR